MHGDVVELDISWSGTKKRAKTLGKRRRTGTREEGSIGGLEVKSSKYTWNHG